jgi:hypothetical protein
LKGPSAINKNPVPQSVQILSYNNKPLNSNNYNIGATKKEPEKIIKNETTFDDDWAMG